MPTAEDIEALSAQNEQAMVALGRDGISLDVLSMLKMRLDYVTEFVIGDDEDRLLAFRYGWEKNLSEVLEHAQSQVNKAKLSVIPGQLVIPGA